MESLSVPLIGVLHEIVVRHDYVLFSKVVDDISRDMRASDLKFGSRV